MAAAGLQGRLGAMRSYFHSAMGLILAAAAAYVVAGETTTAARPNIVLIMADDMGFSGIGCYGSEIATPNLDRLAAEGLRFSRLYNGARCCPTRASLLTCLYAHQATPSDSVYSAVAVT